ncbi:glycosyltransferase [Enterococcus sp. 079]|nr:glycosyltransferase [Enterococcus sp. 079]
MQVIFNGVDIEAYRNKAHGEVKRESLNIPQDAFVVGMVGRISPQKAPEIFIKMARLVKNKIPEAHFIIVGNGEQKHLSRNMQQNMVF